jgi:hypothetical protein
VRPFREILVLVATVVSAALIGVGVPVGWLWIGSQVQGDTGATSLDFSVVILVLFGIIATYVAVLFVAGWIMERADPSVRSDSQRGTARTPWLRGMTDTRAHLRQRPVAAGIERVFVITTLLATVAFWLWLLFLAGSPLPNQ